jgi:hypothetical protein
MTQILFYSYSEMNRRQLFQFIFHSIIISFFFSIRYALRWLFIHCNYIQYDSTGKVSEAEMGLNLEDRDELQEQVQTLFKNMNKITHAEISIGLKRRFKYPFFQRLSKTVSCFDL